MHYSSCRSPQSSNHHHVKVEGLHSVRALCLGPLNALEKYNVNKHWSLFSPCLDMGHWSPHLAPGLEGGMMAWVCWPGLNPWCPKSQKGRAFIWPHLPWERQRGQGQRLPGFCWRQETLVVRSSAAKVRSNDLECQFSGGEKAWISLRQVDLTGGAKLRGALQVLTK